MLRSIAALLLLLPAFALAAPPDLAKAIASVDASQKWERVEIQTAEAGTYALIVWYKVMPASYAEVERDTVMLSRVVLRELQATRMLDSTQLIVVRGRMPARGETDKPLVRVFGTTRYNAARDQLVFEPNK